MKKARTMVAMLFALLMVFCFVGCGDQSSGDEADIVITNGLVYTADGEGTTAEAVAVKGDEIVYVGDAAGAEEMTGNDTRVIDMEGGMVTPGFIDSHQHPYAMAEMMFSAPLYECETAQDYLDEVEKYIKDNPDADKIVAIGFEKPIFDKISPTKETLDKISKDLPIIMFDSGEHASLLNTKALEEIGFLSDDLETEQGETIEKDENGELTGWIMDSERVYGYSSSFTAEQMEEALLAYQDEALSYGLTTTFEDAPGNFDSTMEAYKKLAGEDKLKYRVNAYMRIEPGDDADKDIEKLKKYRDEFSEGKVQVNGAKIFIDGALEAGTAYMKEPYANDPKNYGTYTWEGKTDELNEICKTLESEDLNYHFHAIGDAAVTQALDSIEYAKADATDSKTRPGITHLQFVSPEDVQRFADLDVTAAIQAFWAVYDEYYDQAVDYLGKERADVQYPIQSFFDAGVRVASGSDYPVQTDRPLEAIHEGVNRAYPDDDHMLPPEAEKATVEEMLQSYTLNGAIANFREDEIGTIEVGKKADLVVLNKNLLEIDPEKIAKVKEMFTIFNGEVVYEK